MSHRKNMLREVDKVVSQPIENESRQDVKDKLPDESVHYASSRKLAYPSLMREILHRGRRWPEHFGQDIHYGLRGMRRSPGFTIVAVLSLALGIGGNTAIFSLIDAVLLKLLPVRNPQQLLLLEWSSKVWPDGIVDTLLGSVNKDKAGNSTSTSFSYRGYVAIEANNRVFSNVAASTSDNTDWNVGYKGVPARAQGKLVSGTFFSTLGVEPLLGRALTPDDDRIDASPVAVISYGYWARRFGRDPGVLGQTITVNSIPVTIVGVSPREFYGVQPGRAVEVWLPLHTQPQVEPRLSPESLGPSTGDAAKQAGTLFESRDTWWVLIIGRLKPGVSEQQARTELGVLFNQSISPDVKPRTRPEVIPHLEVLNGSEGLDKLRDQFSKPLFVLMTVVGLVLLIACANVANLLMARGTARRREIAVRLAVGAKRSRLVRQLVTESVLLSAIGGGLGLLFAFWGTHLLVAFVSSGRVPVHLNVSPDFQVLGFTVAVSLLSGTLFGLWPALRSTRVKFAQSLKENSAKTPVTHERHVLHLGLGKTLVVSQVGLSLLLIVGAGLFVRTLTNLQGMNTGFDPHNLLLFHIDPTQNGYQEQRLADFYQEFTRRLQVLPGVNSVTVSKHTMIGDGVSIYGITIPGYSPKAHEQKDKVKAWVNYVGPHFFETMNIPILVGRAIRESDTPTAPKVAVVNAQFVRKYLSSGISIGRQFSLGTGTPDIEIVGVARDAKFGDLRAEPPPTIYTPYLQEVTLPLQRGDSLRRLSDMNFEIRTANDPMALVPLVRQVSQSMDPNLALVGLKSQVEQINETLFQERLLAYLTSFFGLLATLLGCVGVYGIMAFATLQRTREIGIRMALGARRGAILGMVMRETFIVVIIGIAAGTLVVVEISSLIASFLFGLKPNDPLTIFGAAFLMAVVGTLAGYFPARRASRLDPMVALRYE